MSETEKATRITWPSNCRISRNAAEERGRYAMDCVRLEPGSTPDKALLISTNGRSLAVVPVDVQGEVTTPRNIPQLAAQIIEKPRVETALDGDGDIEEVQLDKFVYIDDVGLRLNLGDLEMKACWQEERPEQPYPKWRGVVPPPFQVGSDERIRLGIKVGYLASVCEALGEDRVVLLIDPKNLGNAIRVEIEHDKRGRYGVVMPFTLDEPKPTKEDAKQ